MIVSLQYKGLEQSKANHGRCLKSRAADTSERHDASRLRARQTGEREPERNHGGRGEGPAGRPRFGGKQSLFINVHFPAPWGLMTCEGAERPCCT